MKNLALRGKIRAIHSILSSIQTMKLKLKSIDHIFHDFPKLNVPVLDLTSHFACVRFNRNLPFIFIAASITFDFNEQHFFQRLNNCEQ